MSDDEAMQPGRLVRVRLPIDYPFERLRARIRDQYGYDLVMVFKFGPLQARGTETICSVWAADESRLFQLMREVGPPEVGEIRYAVRLIQIAPSVCG